MTHPQLLNCNIVLCSSNTFWKVCPRNFDIVRNKMTAKKDSEMKAYGFLRLTLHVIKHALKFANERAG